MDTLYVQGQQVPLNKSDNVEASANGCTEVCELHCWNMEIWQIWSH